ncbi:putative glutamine ABC transporter permease protein glnP [Fictibacillus macauensis ZFHKF-1]|uniref:Putative glutamine ABC transporter permease protein glnP n=1 Tax=Fictibacillus macauensis ZFHKF-1 TaxID=1196324 RepID=I8AL60_9BACL|nr:putative glutamine ABC transporter permease protein glnP [Fictibacillus macauensis ZFHKF-1]
MDFFGAYSSDNVLFLLEGLGNTLFVAAIAIVFSFLLGSIIGILRYAKIPVVSHLLAIGVEIIRNLPLLLIILFTKLGLPEVGIQLSVFSAAIIGLIVFESAMLSEIVRSGLTSIEKGQIEAGRSSGLTYIQTVRYIILPQALRRMVPPIVSQFISLLKDTSLAVVISLPELLHNAQIVYGKNSNYVMPIFILVAAMYFIINFSLSIAARKLEQKERKGTKAAKATISNEPYTGSTAL